LTNITSYKNMTFTSYKVLDVPLALQSGFLDLEDADSAISAPNAILGRSNFSVDPHLSSTPRIYVSNDCSSTSASPNKNCRNEFPYKFQPIFMRVKPIGMIQEGSFVLIDIYAWVLKGKEVVNVYGGTLIWGGPGHGSSWGLGLEHWGSNEDGTARGVNVLEMKCSVWHGGERSFAIDDLIVDVLDGHEEE
jgi:hypothetical protein